MKCLEQGSFTEYESVSAARRDVEHYLADEPVEACRPRPLSNSSICP